MKSIRKWVPNDEIELPNAYSYVFSRQSVGRHHAYIDLTTKQHQLLHLLILHRNRLVSYDIIQEHVYADSPFTHNSVASHIRDIRKKITGIPIRAVKDRGHMLRLAECPDRG